MLLGEILRAGEQAVDHGVHPQRHGGIGEEGDLGVGVIGGKGFDCREFFCDGVGDLAAVLRRPDGGGVDAAAPAIGGDAGDDQVDVFFPLVGGVVAEDHLAESGAVQFDARVFGPGLGGGGVAEEHGPVDNLQEGAGAAVVGGIEAKCLARHAGGAEGLDESQRRPGFLAAGLEDNRGLERDRRKPQGMDAGRVAR